MSLVDIVGCMCLLLFLSALMVFFNSTSDFFFVGLISSPHFLTTFDGFSYVTIGRIKYEQIELGLSKELREMLPIVVFRETFSINDSQ